MKNLREKLMMVSSKASSSPRRPAGDQANGAFFVREHHVPLDELCGIEKTTLEEISSCDPNFTGKHWNIHQLLFLDTETTGLSGGVGTVAFQIGLGYIENRCMVIRQYVMRDYCEEASMLADVAKQIERFETLVTFNGKSFDIPLLESRMIMQRIRMPLTELPHFDLLHACRRVYRLRLRRCNLASLEEAVLGETRKDDLPGAMVPQRYFDYLKTREFALLEDVLRHNCQDVQSLAALTGHICSVFREPERISYPEDLFGVGRTFERTGQVQRARVCYRILGHSSMSPDAHMRLSLSYKKEKNWEEAKATWNDMIARGEGGTWPYIEAAKYYEHICRDIPKALSYAKAALAYELNTRLLFEREPAENLHMYYKRIERLNEKQKALLHDRFQED